MFADHNKINSDNNSSGQMLFAFGIDHRTAPVEVREKLYIRNDETQHLLEQFKKTLSECVILSTCNRTEIYGVAPSESIDIDGCIDKLIEFKNAADSVNREHFFTAISCSASMRLFQVATGIESQILGDSQILQQFKNAYSQARGNDSAGRILNQLSQRALKIARRSYTDTDIHKGAVSISHAAVELANETLETIRGISVMLAGAGETAHLTAEELIKRRVGKIYITNRTRERADEFKQHLLTLGNIKWEVLDFGEFKKHLNDVDMLISSTGADEPIINADDLAGQHRKILMIDIAVPRDIAEDTGKMPNVTLKNIDDLTAAVGRNAERRQNAVPQVKKLIMQEMGDFLMWYYSLPLLPSQKKTRSKTDKATANEFLKVKEFLKGNISELHKAAMRDSGDAKSDLQNHIELVERLKQMKDAAYEGALNG